MAGAGDLGQVHSHLASELANRRSGVRSRESRLIDRRQIVARARNRGGLAIDLGWRRLRRGCGWLRLRYFQSWRFDRLCIGFGNRPRRLHRKRIGFRGALGVLRLWRLALRAHRDDQIAFGNLAALGDVHLLDLAHRRRRHIHGGLVGLERDERSVDFDGVAGLDQHINDGDVLEAPQVGHSHFRRTSHRCARLVRSSRDRGSPDRYPAPASP